MVLKHLIEYLEKCDQEIVCSIGFDTPHSYRGSYDELAFEPKENITVREMLDEARSAMGEVYDGYKGGEYKMGEWTTVNLAYWGELGEEIGIVLLDYMTGKVRTKA